MASKPVDTLNAKAAPAAATKPKGPRVQTSASRDLFAGVVPIQAPNYLRFVFNGSTKPPFIFDAFILQRMSSTRKEQFTVHYTNGEPIVDVFNTVPEIVTVAVTLSDAQATATSDPNAGYLVDGFEYIRAFYEEYFRVSAAAGKYAGIAGGVELVSKHRVMTGALLRLAADRTADPGVITDVAFDMVVLSSTAPGIRPAVKVQTV